MDLNVSQIDDLVYQAPQPANYYGVMTTEESPTDGFDEEQYNIQSLSLD